MRHAVSDRRATDAGGLRRPGPQSSRQRNEALRLAIIGCLLLVGGNGGLAWAEQYVPTGYAALIVAVTPIWFLILEVLVFRGDRLSRRGLVGMALGFTGIAVLFWPKFEHRAASA